MTRSLSQNLIDAAGALGIPAGAIHLVDGPEVFAADEEHRQSVTLRHLRTIEADEDTPFDLNSSVWPGPTEAFLTVFEVEVVCRPPPDQRDRPYYPNECRLLATAVRRHFRGQQASGLIIPRQAWEKPGAPEEGNGITLWQRTDTVPRDPEDLAHATMLTYELHWWAPAT